MIKSSVRFRKNGLKKRSKKSFNVSAIRSFKYLHLKSCESTQDVIQSVSSGWFLLWSDVQKAGRGTGGRQWISPEGGLYYSLAFPSDVVVHSDPLILLGAAYVWKQLLSEQFPEIADGLELKWPNDLLHDGRKLGGLLANKRGGMFYLGVGINVNNSLDDTRETLRGPPISLLELTDRTLPKEELLLSWSDRFYAGVTRDYDNIFDSSNLEEHLSTIGLDIKVRGKAGKAVGLGDNGELIANVDNNTVRVHSADDVEVITREAHR